MLLTKHRFENGIRWAVDGQFLPTNISLSLLLGLSRGEMQSLLEDASGGLPAFGEEEAPIDPTQEVWAAGVTYLQSRDARKAESIVADMYQKVYEAERQTGGYNVTCRQLGIATFYLGNLHRGGYHAATFGALRVDRG